ncbi:Nse4 C-terminal-domain-containing protein [Melampsora americana]|nr:Nse4 C-terminal-domain-containing protein [Melampsora americana]
MPSNRNKQTNEGSEDNEIEVQSEEGSEDEIIEEEGGGRGPTERDLLTGEEMNEICQLTEDREGQLIAKRSLREHYERAMRIRSDPKTITHESFHFRVQSLDGTFESVMNPGIATIDAQALRLLSEAQVQRTRDLKTEIESFNVDDFMSHFTKILGKRGLIDSDEDDEDDEGHVGNRSRGFVDWEKAGRRLMRYSRRAPTMDVMYGPLDIEHKKRKITQRVKVIKDPSQKTAPQEIAASDLNASLEETIRLTKSIRKNLRHQPESGVNFFKFFINPNSFSQSVENLFFISFLIKDGTAAIENDDQDGNPREFPIILASEIMSKKEIAEGAIKAQVIMELTMQDWEDAIELFDIREPMIDHRDPKPLKSKSS